MIYIYGLIGSYAFYILTKRIKYKGNLFFVLGVCCIGIIPIFRGNVGTDTFSYEMIASAIRQGDGLQGLERGFSSLISILQVFMSDRVAIRALAVIYCLTLLIYIFNANKNEIFYLFVFYIPVFFYQNSMNVLRIGLASNFVLLAIQFYRRAEFWVAFILFLISILFHYSAIFLVFYCWILMGKNTGVQIFYGSLGLFCFFLLIWHFNPQYLLEKVDLYSNYESPSYFSGLGRVIPIIILQLGVWKSNLKKPVRRKLIAASLFVCSVFYIGTFYSYAALRFLDLGLFALSISIIIVYNQNKLIIEKSVRYGLFIAGLLAFAASYRGWLVNFGVLGYPFLPYSFF